MLLEKNMFKYLKIKRHDVFNQPANHSEKCTYIYIYIKHKLYTERKGTAEQIGQNASN